MADYRVNVDVKVNTSNLDAAEKKINSLKNKTVDIKFNTNASDVSSQINKSLKNVKSNTKIKVDVDTKNVISQLRSAYKRMDSLQRQKVGLGVDSSEYKTVETEINRLIKRAAELQSQLGGNLPNSIFDDISENSNRAAADIDRMVARVKDASRKMATAFVGDIDSGKLNVGFEKLSADMDKISNKTPELRRAFDDLSKTHQNLSNVSGFLDAGDYDAVIRAQTEYNSKLKQTGNLIREAQIQHQRMQRSIAQAQKQTSLDDAKNVLSGRIDAWLNSNSAAAAQFGDSLNDIKARIADVNDSASLNHLKSEFQQVQLEAQRLDKTGLTFGDRLKRQLKEYSAYVGIAGLFAAGGQAAREMAQNVLEVDTAMTGLYRVTDMTAAQYDKLYSDMISASKEYGTTLTDTINATADWVRAGFDADTALGLADVTAMYQHVSDLDYDEASQNLLTAYNGFKDSFNQEFGGDAVASVEHIADAFNELDKISCP